MKRLYLLVFSLIFTSPLACALNLKAVWQHSFEIPINVAAFSPDGQKIALAWGIGNVSVQIWNITTNTLVQELVAPQGIITAIAWGPNGQEIAVGFESLIAIYDAMTGQLGRTFKVNNGENSFAQIWWQQNDITQLHAVRSSLNEEGNIMHYVLDSSTGYIERAQAIHIDQQDAMALGMSWDEKYLAIAHNESQIDFLDIATGKYVRTLTLPLIPLAVRWSPDNNLIAIGLFDYAVLIVDAKTWDELQTNTQINTALDWCYVFEEKYFACGSVSVFKVEKDLPLFSGNL